MQSSLLSGNEAIARGAWEAGVVVGVGHPGTPSTETLQTLATMDSVYAEWAPNEKVALEVAAGVSFAGGRALVAMTHVGLNVAADPLFTLAYTGVRGGLVILVADDPGMHSSQNEQDSRNYAAFARVPMLEPSDSAEALAFARAAFELSEVNDIPVLIRSTVRVSHSKSLVSLGTRAAVETPSEFRSDPAKWVMLPAMAKARRLDLDRRVATLAELAETSDFNRVEYRDTTVGIVCSGICYQHVREGMPDASVLKLGLTFPLPAALLREFASRVDALHVVEEADDYLARALRALGIEVKPLQLPVSGELSPGSVGEAFGHAKPVMRELDDTLPPRPPLMCPGCPHRPVFDALRRARAVVTGDLGCYMLGALRPLSAMDSCVAMGASIGMAHGAELVGSITERPIVAVIGDSTFAHSGVASLMNTVYNGGTGTILILDNRITAMTGHQGNPFNGITLQARASREVDLERLVRSLGVSRVRVENPHSLAAVRASIAEETAAPELSVIIFRAPCALLVREKGDPYAVDLELCTKCGACINLGCPAIGKNHRTSQAYIDVATCVGCAQCVQVCNYSAIVHVGPACDFKGADTQ